MPCCLVLSPFHKHFISVHLALPWKAAAVMQCEGGLSHSLLYLWQVGFALGFHTQLGYLKASYRLIPLQCLPTIPFTVLWRASCWGRGTVRCSLGSVREEWEDPHPASTCFDSTLWLKRVLSNCSFFSILFLAFSNFGSIFFPIASSPSQAALFLQSHGRTFKFQ